MLSSYTKIHLTLDFTMLNGKNRLNTEYVNILNVSLQPQANVLELISEPSHPSTNLSQPTINNMILKSTLSVCNSSWFLQEFLNFELVKHFGHGQNTKQIGKWIFWL